MKEKIPRMGPGKEQEGQVPSFGEYLRRERELREISLREIVDETKISYRYLEALESDNRSRLPAEVFIKGFIRSYAAYVGLDPDEAVLRYQEYQKTREITGGPQETGRTPAPGGARKASGLPWPRIAAVLAAALAAALIFYGYRQWKVRWSEPVSQTVEAPAPEVVPEGGGEGAPQAPPEPAPQAEPTPPEEAPESGGEAAPPSGAETPVAQRPMEVTLSALERTWLQADVDGERHYDVTLQPGEEIRFDLRDAMRLTVGNAGGLVIRAQGRRLGPLGASGQVVKDFRITRGDLAGGTPE